MFNNKKSRVFATVLIIVIILAMVAPMVVNMFA